MERNHSCSAPESVPPSARYRSHPTWCELISRVSKSGAASGMIRLPAVPSIRHASPGSVTPAARVEAAKSAPPTATGVPSRSPVSRAAAAVTRPAMAWLGLISGSHAGSTPSAAHISGDHARARQS